MYTDAWQSLCGLYDSVYGPYQGDGSDPNPDDDEPDDEDDDGFRDMALDEESNPCDSEGVEEDGWRD